MYPTQETETWYNLPYSTLTPFHSLCLCKHFHKHHSFIKNQCCISQTFIQTAKPHKVYSFHFIILTFSNCYSLSKICRNAHNSNTAFKLLSTRWLLTRMIKTVTSLNQSSPILSSLQFTLIHTCFPVKFKCELKLYKASLTAVLHVHTLFPILNIFLCIVPVFHLLPVSVLLPLPSSGACQSHDLLPQLQLLALILHHPSINNEATFQ